MQLQLGFEVGTNKETATWLNEQQSAIESNAQAMIDKAISMGRVLLEVHGKCEYGDFSKWIDENINISRRHSYNYMTIVKNLNHTEVANSKNYFAMLKAAEKIQADARAIEFKKQPELVHIVHNWQNYYTENYNKCIVFMEHLNRLKTDTERLKECENTLKVCKEIIKELKNTA